MCLTQDSTRKHHSISEVMEIQANATRRQAAFSTANRFAFIQCTTKQKDEFHSHTFCVTSTKQAKLK